MWQPQKSNQILVPLGGDYQTAAYTFENIDSLIRYVNAKVSCATDVRYRVRFFLCVCVF